MRMNMVVVDGGRRRRRHGLWRGHGNGNGNGGWIMDVGWPERE